MKIAREILSELLDSYSVGEVDANGITLLDVTSSGRLLGEIVCIAKISYENLQYQFSYICRSDGIFQDFIFLNEVNSDVICKEVV